MIAEIKKWGNSRALRIPKALALEAGLDFGAKAELVSVDGQIRIIPVEKSRYDLDKMLASIPEGYQFEEWDTGPPVGKEVWW